MYTQGAGLVKPQQDMFRQGSPAMVGVPSLSGVPPAGASWVKLKTYPARQPGQPFRGTRFNRTRNKWGSFVSYHGREVEIASHDREQDAALAHDTKVLELYGAQAPVNFPNSALLDPITKRVRRLRTANGREVPFPMEHAKGIEGLDAAAMTAGQQDIHRRSPARTLSPSIDSSGVMGTGGVLGVNRYAGSVDAAKQPPLPTRVPRAPIGVEGVPQPQEEWMPLPERAYTAADVASVSNAREHDAGLVYEIVFPRPGALGLNLRSYLVEPSAGARPGINPYGCLEVLEAQGVYLQVVVESGDLLIAINGDKLSGNNFAFEKAIEKCSRAPMPRVLRFARIRGASTAAIECALDVEACAVFEADGHPQRLVTAQLHPSAPPYFHLNPPRKKTRPTSRGSDDARHGFGSSGSDGGSTANAAATIGTVGASASGASSAQTKNSTGAAPMDCVAGTTPCPSASREDRSSGISIASASISASASVLPGLSSVSNTLTAPPAVAKTRQPLHHYPQRESAVMSGCTTARIATPSGRTASMLPPSSAFSGLRGIETQPPSVDTSM